MGFDEKIAGLAEGLRELTIQRRRDLHAHPEAGWTEFRTAAFVAETLTNLAMLCKSAVRLSIRRR